MEKGKELFFRWKALRNIIDNISDTFRKPDSLLTKDDIRQYERRCKKLNEHFQVIKNETDEFLGKEVEE